MNGKDALTFLAVICLVIAAFSYTTAFSNTYQIQWRTTFANNHLDLAQASSAASTQAHEISKSIELLDTYPKIGNFNPLNKLDPKTDLTNTWNALTEMQTYAENSAKLNNTDPAYQIAVYNTQEKIQYFQDNYKDSFNTYTSFGLSGYLSAVAAIFVLLSAVFACLNFFVEDEREYNYRYSEKKRFSYNGLVCGVVLLFVVALVVFALAVTVSPVFYLGPV